LEHGQVGLECGDAGHVEPHQPLRRRAGEAQQLVVHLDQHAELLGLKLGIMCKSLGNQRVFRRSARYDRTLRTQGRPMPRQPGLWKREEDGWWYTPVRRKQVKLAKDKKEARKALYNLLARQDEPVRSTRISFRKLADRFLD